MKQFLIRISYFFIVTLILLSTTLISLRILVNKKISFDLEPYKSILIVGDSHPACAFNDSIYKKAVNLARGGESYLYTYLKTKAVLKEYPNIDTIILGFSYHNLQGYQEKRIKEDRYMHAALPRYFFFMDTNDNLRLISQNVLAYTTALKQVFTNSFMLLSNKENYRELNVGGFVGKKICKLQQSIDSLSINEEIYTLKKVANIELKYLKKIKIYCETNNVELFLVATPIHQELLRRERVFEISHYSIYNKLLNNIDFLDYTKFQLEDSLYMDVGHLNYYGAEVFTKYFINAIAN